MSEKRKETKTTANKYVRKSWNLDIKFPIYANMIVLKPILMHNIKI